MATRWDPSSTTQYTPQMILGGQSGQGIPAFSDADVQQLQQAGVTMGDLQNLGVLGAPEQAMTGGSQGYVPGGGAGTQNQQWGLTDQGQRQLQNATMLKVMLSAGGGRQQQKDQPPPENFYGSAYPLYAQDAQGNPTGKPVYATPTNQPSLLAAAALQMPAVINPPPSAALDPRSGVSKVGGALIGTSVPTVPALDWQGVAQAGGIKQADIDNLKAMGLTPADVAQKFNLSLKGPLAGPWSTQPGTFLKAAPVAPTMALGATPLQAAVQPTAIAYNPTATPFAQA